MPQLVLDSFGLVFSPEFLKPLFRIISFFAVGLLTLKLVDSALKRVVLIGDSGGRNRMEQRAETLRHVVRSVGKAILGVVLVLYITNELGFPLAPLLTGAGIAGLAIGFGAQSLVKDVIAGFFVLLEDQYGVGDVVRIGGQEGAVEEMTLRVTVLRSGDGEIHVIPNGTIQTVSVLSRDWRRAVVDVPVAAREDLGRVFDVLNRTGEKLAADLPRQVLEPPRIVGVERLGGEGVTVRLDAKTTPLKQAEVAHEWRRRIKESFDREGIALARLEEPKGRG